MKTVGILLQLQSRGSLRILCSIAVVELYKTLFTLVKLLIHITTYSLHLISYQCHSFYLHCQDEDN